MSKPKSIERDLDNGGFDKLLSTLTSKSSITELYINICSVRNSSLIDLKPYLNRHFTECFDIYLSALSNRGLEGNIHEFSVIYKRRFNLH